MTALPISVALVDDEPRTLRAFRWEFGEDFQIKTFCSGSELIGALEAGEHFDVLISDQRMPGMTGDEVLKLVSQKFPRMRRLVMTAFADVAPLRVCINEAGIDGYLEKPWDPIEVREFVKRSHAKLLQEVERERRRVLAANERWAAIRGERERDIVQICQALGFGASVCSTFFQILDLSSVAQPYDWSDLLLVDKAQEQELALDFLSTIESLMSLGSEWPDSGRRALFYWWMLLKECPEGLGGSYFQHQDYEKKISLSFDAGAPFGDSILDPCGDQDPQTLRRNALLLLIIRELQSLGGSLDLDADKVRFRGDLLIVAPTETAR